MSASNIHCSDCDALLGTVHKPGCSKLFYLEKDCLDCPQNDNCCVPPAEPELSTASSAETWAYGATPAPATESCDSLVMWAIHIQGPDDIFPAPDKEIAEAIALVWNRQYTRHSLASEIHIAAVVIPWPYGYELWAAEKDLLRLEVGEINSTAAATGKPGEQT